jgi:hypothetical protein
MGESLVSKQDYAKAFHIAANTYVNYNPTSILQVSPTFNRYGPIGGRFDGLVDIVTNIALVDGYKA